MLSANDWEERVKNAKENLTLNNLLAAYSSVGLAFFFLWCVPYNFVLKQKVLEYLMGSKFWSVGSRVAPYAGVGCALLAWKCMRDERLRREREARERDGHVTEEDGSGAVFTKKDMLERIASTTRFYLAFFGAIATLFTIRAKYLVGDNLENLIALENRYEEEVYIYYRQLTPPPATTSVS